MKLLAKSTISKNNQTTVKSEVRAIAALDLQVGDNMEWYLIEASDNIPAGAVVVWKVKQ